MPNRRTDVFKRQSRITAQVRHYEQDAQVRFLRGDGFDQAAGSIDARKARGDDHHNRIKMPRQIAALKHQTARQVCNQSLKLRAQGGGTDGQIPPHSWRHPALCRPDANRAPEYRSHGQRLH